MQLITDQQIRVSLSIEDALKRPEKVSLKIEAAHSGVLNGNFLFYLPNALQTGSDSLNSFYKPLQSKHYSKTIGYFYKSNYVSTNTSSEYFNKITKATTRKDMINSVKQYLKSQDYMDNPKGFGVLVANAKLYDKKKILDLKSKDIGTVSIAGDASDAYCSICEEHLGECKHELGKKYSGNRCFGVVAGDFLVDHISFETIPANWETNTLIVADSLNVGNVELIEEGHLMKLSLSDLKEKVGNIEEFLRQLTLETLLEKYVKEASVASKSEYLLVEEKLLPINTPLTIYVASKALELLEETEDKEVLVQLLGTSFSDLFKDKTEEEILEILSEPKETTVPTLEPEKTEPELVVEPTLENKTLEVADSDKIALAIADSLSVTFESQFTTLFNKISELFTKENNSKANKILQDKVTAYKEEIENFGIFNNQIADDLKESILNQILYLKNISKDSDYFLKLKDRSIQELKMTLEDHIELSGDSKQPELVPEITNPVLEVEDANKTANLVKTEGGEALVAMEEPIVLEIEDASVIVEKYVSAVESKLTKEEFTKLYKTAVQEYGSHIARALRPALKAQNKI